MTRRLLIYCLLCVLIFLVYSQTISLPFVQDDYTFLNIYQNNNTGQILKETFAVHRYFYRPLSRLYFYGMYLVFGADPVPFHVVALIIHFLTCVLIIKLFSALSGNDAIGIATGYIYAFAGVIHIECFIWAVGGGELLSMLFLVLSILLFVHGRYWASALVYLAAGLFKESAMPLVLVLLFICRRQTWRHWIFFTLLLIPKFIGQSQLTLPADAPYRVDLFGWHVSHIFTAYLTWLSQAFNPFGFIALVSLCLFNWGRHKPLAVWLFITIAPVLFMPNHVYRYYMITALPVVCFAFVSFVDRYMDRRVLVGAVAVILLFSFSYINGVLGGVPMRGGTNNLIQKIERAR